MVICVIESRAVNSIRHVVGRPEHLRRNHRLGPRAASCVQFVFDHFLVSDFQRTVGRAHTAHASRRCSYIDSIVFRIPSGFSASNRLEKDGRNKQTTRKKHESESESETDSSIKRMRAECLAVSGNTATEPQTDSARFLCENLFLVSFRCIRSDWESCALKHSRNSLVVPEQQI